MYEIETSNPRQQSCLSEEYQQSNNKFIIPSDQTQLINRILHQLLFEILQSSRNSVISKVHSLIQQILNNYISLDLIRDIYIRINNQQHLIQRYQEYIHVVDTILLDQHHLSQFNQSIQSQEQLDTQMKLQSLELPLQKQMNIGSKLSQEIEQKIKFNFYEPIDIENDQPSQSSKFQEPTEASQKQSTQNEQHPHSPKKQLSLFKSVQISYNLKQQQNLKSPNSHNSSLELIDIDKVVRPSILTYNYDNIKQLIAKEKQDDYLSSQKNPIMSHHQSIMQIQRKLKTMRVKYKLNSDRSKRKN